MASTSATGDARVLWLAMVQRLIGRASHDVKDALNGVAVNLEVIRSRAEREGTPASAVASFAGAAGQQLERLTSLLEALLALARPEREPVDVGVALRRVATLCAASGSAGASVEVDDSAGEGAVTSLPGEIVRLALAAPMLEAVSGSRDVATVHCALRVEGTEVHVRMGTEGGRVDMPAAVADPLRDAGLRWTSEGNDSRVLSLAFPRA